MEVFVDFGLFELIAATGIAALARVVYSRRIAGMAILVASVGSPVLLVLLVSEGLVRWLAVASLGFALLNAVVVLGVVRSGLIPSVLGHIRLRRREIRGGSTSGA